MLVRVVMLLTITMGTAVTAHAQLEHVLPDDAVAASQATIVEGRGLIFSPQIISQTGGDLKAQVGGLLADVALFPQGLRVARLNVYVAPGVDAADVQRILAASTGPEFRPATSFVTTRLPHPEALLAMDTVCVADSGIAANPPWNVLPAGTRVFISGQAEKGDGTLADATRKTLESLLATLQFLGLDKQDVVQVKCFLTPMDQASLARRQVEEFFPGERRPALTLVEWQSTLPVEIEIVASGTRNPDLASGRPLEVRTPPGMKASPVYSRLAIVRHPRLIFTGGIVPADAAASAEAQVRSVFAELKRALDASGSDWSHLAKATYYVSDDDVSKWHNMLRPEYFNPRRPPAASKAAVSGVGFPQHKILLDMIAVPAE